MEMNYYFYFTAYNVDYIGKCRDVEHCNLSNNSLAVTTLIYVFIANNVDKMSFDYTI